ncbi:glutamate--cysteine ligase [Cryobacterium tepidiphilum]|jgi:carboxylate-amine ligase|uniref:Putative glutamate--cysteine ligase 2 n=1 Tax=Cryobacterium tepidiphilum TaxID=2486026 RepID=A0A3M8KYY3_9MICO|nr:glutamate--cysteine ligase [Cryobacterium tepidiphilum]RNE58493.1 glutamate--cysteine ligase [Cryobacterium tepidiphilum]
MGIDFARSRRSTVGIEWELALVDRLNGDLVSVADRVLDALRGPDGSDHPHITGELLLNTVELVSGVHERVADAVADLQGQVAEVRAVTDPLGVDPVCSGSHPFGQWFDQTVTDKERYHRLIERTQWWGRNMMIWGIHVHVGIEDRDKVIPILNGLTTYIPHLQALSASSPFWAGVDTGYASNRALMFQQLPTAGLPWHLPDWAAWEGYVDDMITTGIIDDATEVRWDIRPSARWGTIEVRVCDGVSTPSELGAIAALIQCLVEWMSTELDAGRPVPTMQPWFVRENKWRAARYGLDAEIILDSAANERLVTDEVRRLMGALGPVAERLGCVAELASLDLILEHGASYQRQRKVAASHWGDLSVVVASLSRELKNGLIP